MVVCIAFSVYAQCTPPHRRKF